MSTISQLKNINLMTKSQYESISPNSNELYCIAGHFIIESYYSANYWYEIYSNGFIKQGGKVNVATTAQITYPISFKSPPLKVTVDSYNQPADDTSDVNYVTNAKNINNTGFTLCYFDSASAAGRTGLCTWEAKGY